MEITDCYILGTFPKNKIAYLCYLLNAYRPTDHKVAILHHRQHSSIEAILSLFLLFSPT